MSEKQRTWNKYEAVVLLDGLLKILGGSASKQDVITSVSQTLRNMAENQGEKIDEIFRNENGIYFQLQSMESAFKGYTITKPATKLFSTIVETYQTDRETYNKWLEEAEIMANKNQSHREEFMSYLATKISSEKLTEASTYLDEIEHFCLNRGIIDKPLFEIKDTFTIKNVRQVIEHNGLFRLKHLGNNFQIMELLNFYIEFVNEKFEERDKSSLGQEKLEHAHQNETTVDEKPLDQDTSKVDNVSLARTKEDKRLLQKYPIIYKRVFLTLKNSLNIDLTIEDIQRATQHIGRVSNIEEILDNASWVRINEKGYSFSTSNVSHDTFEKTVKEEIDIVGHNNLTEGNQELERFIINFEKLEDLFGTEPYRITYFGDSITPCSTWKELYISFFDTLYDDYPHKFKPNMTFSTHNGQFDLITSEASEQMNEPVIVEGSNYVIETKLESNDIVAKIKYLLDLCAVDYENVEIFYRYDFSHDTLKETEKTQSIKKQQIDSKNSRNEFYQYLLNTKNLSLRTAQNYSYAIEKCENFAKQNNFKSWRLYSSDYDEVLMIVNELLQNANFLELNKRGHNMYKAALSKFLEFSNVDEMNTIKTTDSDYGNEKFEKVLNRYFKKGMRIGSPIEIRKFKVSYAEMYGEEPQENDNKINEIIYNLCIISGNRAYLPNMILSDELKEKVTTFIDNSFQKGASAVYYKALCEQFAEDFLDYPLYDNPEMLKTYLKSTIKDDYFFNRSCITKGPNVLEDPINEIRLCLIEYNRPMKYSEIFKSLPHIPLENIKSVLSSNGEFVYNADEEYFHESIIQLSDVEISSISEILNKVIVEKDFIAGNELYKIIQAKYPYIIENNQEISMQGFREFFKYKFKDQFTFKGNIISAPDHDLSMTDVFANFARKHESFTLAELQTFASELSTVIYFDPVYENSLRISQEMFVSKEQANFFIDETDDALNRVCTEKYISIQEVNNFASFPNAGFPWNSFLLENYVAYYSKQYTLLHVGFNQNKCAGAIVKRSSGINSFDDFIVEFLAESEIELEENAALQLLANNGYLARRRYSNIKNIIIRANAQRNQKEII